MAGFVGNNRAAIRAAVHYRHYGQGRVFSPPPPRASVVATIQAVTEVIESPGVTLADLQSFAAIVAEAIRTSAPPEQLTERVEQAAPKFAQVNQLLRDNPHWIALLGIVVTVLIALLQPRATDHHQDPELRPEVVVIAPPDRAEIERIVEEKLHELEDQEPAGTGSPVDGPEGDDKQQK
jgi:hypothetical protein